MTDHSTPTTLRSHGEYSSRNRWLGSTPEMLIWRIDSSCPLLDLFARSYSCPKGPLKTQNVLKPLYTIGQAIQDNRIVDDYAVLLPQDKQDGASRYSPLGFNIKEGCVAFGGLETVKASCGSCTANVAGEADTVPLDQDSHSNHLGGCSGMLPGFSTQTMHETTRKLQDARRPIPRPPWRSAANTNHLGSLADQIAKVMIQMPFFCKQAGIDPPSVNTNLAASNLVQPLQRMWHGLLGLKKLSRTLAGQLAGQLNRHLEVGQDLIASSELVEFTNACQSAFDNGQTISLQAVPHGFSDGHDWWLGPHCGHCFAPMLESESYCVICKRDSGPVPVKKRRIMGWAPYWPLETVVGTKMAQKLVENSQR